jgi:hypothetical protein
MVAEKIMPKRKLSVLLRKRKVLTGSARVIPP